MENIPFDSNEHFAVSRKPMLGPLVFAWMSLVVIFFGYQIMGGLLALAITGLDMQHADPTSLRTATMIGQLVFLLLPTVGIARIAGRILLEENFSVPRVLLLKPVKIPLLVFASLGSLGIQGLAQAWSFIQSQTVNSLPVPNELVKFMKSMNDMLEGVYGIMLTAHSGGEFAYVILVVAVVPAISEELLFRGLFQQSLKLRLSPKAAVIISGVTFALFHFNIAELLPLVAIGIFLAFLAERTGSIYVPIAAHFTNNAIAALGVYLFGLETVNTKPSSSEALIYLLAGVIGFGLLAISITGINKSKNL